MGNYSMIAFTSWDYGSLGDKETKLKQRNILYRLQVGGTRPSLGSTGPDSLKRLLLVPLRWIWRRSGCRNRPPISP